MKFSRDKLKLRLELSKLIFLMLIYSSESSLLAKLLEGWIIGLRLVDKMLRSGKWMVGWKSWYDNRTGKTLAISDDTREDNVLPSGPLVMASGHTVASINIIMLVKGEDAFSKVALHLVRLIKEFISRLT